VRAESHPASLATAGIRQTCANLLSRPLRHTVISSGFSGCEPDAGTAPPEPSAVDVLPPQVFVVLNSDPGGRILVVDPKGRLKARTKWDRVSFARRSL
jgi:hypothetical protein